MGLEVGGGYRKSTASGGGGCLEAAATADGVLVRDSKAPEGAVLVFDRVAWGEFLVGARAGEFDLVDADPSG